MAAHRYLGAAWASVHGPSDPARLLRWLCDQRFRGLVPGPAPRPIDWARIRELASDFPVSFPAVRVASVLSERSPTAGLASTAVTERDAALRAVAQAAALADRVGTRLIVVEPGIVPLLGDVPAEDLGDPAVQWSRESAQPLLARRKASLEGALDRVCRALFELCKSHPEKRFCLTAGRSLRAVASPATLAWIYEDLAAQGLGYWHDAALVARREEVVGEAQGEWLEAFSSRCVGCTLGDSRADGLYLPPGSGGVDYPLVTSYLRRGAKAVAMCLELDPAVTASELPGMLACLDKFGL
ncbi:MAG: hypothetical protein AB7O97_08595 [Planctomycetota bacterium]